MTEILFDENGDWDKRVLCSDEACIGTIGPDGRCRECGKPYQGVLPEGKQHTALNTAPSGQQAGDDGVTDEDWDNRVLCPDESCIGVIGPDGKCKECGKTL
ncbi:MAG TPA: hypothetical protein P5040_02210 [Smithella sp.]|nr:hypothetical protein [Smithella sp.]HRS96968.1 hypothetical protein [Smithella sp.]